MKYIVFSWLYLLTLFAISQFVFDRAHLYQELWWLDIPMHVLGGFGVGSFFLSVFEYKKRAVTYRTIFLLYIVIALGWEFLEAYKGFTNLQDFGDVIDTLADLFNGALGAAIAYRVIKGKLL